MWCQRVRMTKSKYQGSALISALFIMTLIAITATAMSMRFMIEIYRTQLINNSDKLYLSSEAVRFWAMGLMSDPKQRLNINLGHALVAKFPKSQDIPKEIQLNGYIYDLQSLFNLNNLQDRSWIKTFQNLLSAGIPNLTEAEQQNLQTELIYWLSPYHPDNIHDSVVETYKSKTPPILPAYQAMSSVSEFRLINGISQARYQALSPYITALPSITRININTASKTLIKCLGHHLNDEKLAPLLKLRKKGIHDFKSIETLLERYQIPSQLITLDSEYFLVKARAQMPDLSLTVYSILKREVTAKGPIKVSLISESINTL